MDFLIRECLEMILFHLRPADVNRLIRVSKATREAVAPFEERYWSGTRLVQEYRAGDCQEGVLTMHWVSRNLMVTFAVEPLLSARDILASMWRLRQERSAGPWSLFVDVKKLLFGNYPMRVPHYLFKTELVDEHYSTHIERWPIYITCRLHPSYPCHRCKHSERFLG